MGGVLLGPMAITVTVQLAKHKRGNPNWGRPIPFIPALPTEFEMQARQLQLTAEMYMYSRELRMWCERNRNRVYVPEWLLKEWGITVEVNFAAA